MKLEYLIFSFIVLIFTGCENKDDVRLKKITSRGLCSI